MTNPAHAAKAALSRVTIGVTSIDPQCPQGQWLALVDRISKEPMALAGSSDPSSPTLVDRLAVLSIFASAADMIRVLRDIRADSSSEHSAAAGRALKAAFSHLADIHLVSDQAAWLELHAQAVALLDELLA